MVLIILALTFVVSRYFNPDATDNFVDNVIDFPSKIFHKDKTASKTDSSLIITGTTLTIRSWDFSNEDLDADDVIVDEKNNDEEEVEDVLSMLLSGEDIFSWVENEDFEEENEDLEEENEDFEEENEDFEVNIDNLLDSVVEEVNDEIVVGTGNDEELIWNEVEEVEEIENIEDLVEEENADENNVEIIEKEEIVIEDEKDNTDHWTEKKVENISTTTESQTDQNVKDTQDLIDSLIK